MPVSTTGDLVAGRYRMGERLGAGGMATVFLAVDERLEREVAIKRLHADSPEEVGRRFTREAKVGASLNHPNIVGVYDTVTDDEGLLIVMEYVGGHTLRDEIARGPLEPARAIEVLCAVAAALDHAHQHGVVHRDVKPANVLLDDDRDIVKLADLGIAAAAEHTRITHSGAVMGTAAYMAPERLDGGAGGPAVDVYALAAVAFEMLSGEKAVPGTSPLEIARRVATQPPPDLRDTVRAAPEGAAEALRRGMAKDPADRQATAGEMVRELAGAYAAQAESERSQRRTAALAPPPPPPPSSRDNGATTAPRFHRSDRSSRRRWIVPAILGVVALLLIAAIVALSSGGGDPESSSASRDNGAKPAQDKKQSDSGESSAQDDQGQQPAAPAQPEPAPEPAGGADTPDGAISSFYTAAANDDYDTAWALLTPRAQGELQGRDAFEAQQSTLESIEFPKLKVEQETADGATVAFNSIAHHTDKTDKCKGTIGVVRDGAGWKVDDFQQINCKTGP